jgi:thiol reductant ABC exporter CydD subunit
VTRDRQLERRLWRLGRPARRFAAALVVLGVTAALLVVARATILADVIAAAFAGSGPAELEGRLSLLLLIAAGSAAVAWLTETAAHAAAAGVKSSLRMSLLQRVAAAGIEPGARTGELAAAAGRGIDGLDAWFARYAPALGLSVAVPIVVILRIARADLFSALIVGVTLPLIPVFGALVGAAARPRAERQWQAFSDLGAGMLETLRALPTLKVFGRHADDRVAELTERHRRETMGALRVAFLSALVLELAATISVAVVAVSVGLRVLNGGLPLEPAVLVLVLAPEAYLPLRRVAAEFHAAAEGAAALDRILDVVDRPPPRAGGGSPPPPLPATIEMRSVTVRRPGRGSVLSDVHLVVRPGEHLAIVGPSGAGKSTLLALLLGLVEPDDGAVLVDGMPLTEIDGDAWRRGLGWLGQDPHLFDGTIADNVRFADPAASDARVDRALEAAGAGFVADLAAGRDAPVGERGVLLSAGQRARIALARALVREPRLLLLDEPTAHLDPVSEATVVGTLQRLQGKATVVTVAHRPALAACADRVVHLEFGTIAEVAS